MSLPGRGGGQNHLNGNVEDLSQEVQQGDLKERIQGVHLQIDHTNSDLVGQSQEPSLGMAQLSHMDQALEDQSPVVL